MNLDHLNICSTKPPPPSTIDCKHYDRGCKLVTPCCDKIYTCRFCHDDAESHQLIRTSVREIVCSSCDTRQPARSSCANCRLIFGRYTCVKCNLYDYKFKGQFHCDGCGLCRVGGQDRYYHCDKCDTCMPHEVTHKCIERASRGNCPVCLEDMHTSKIPCHIPVCGHLLHRNCYNDLLVAGHYSCPICQVSLPDMTALWLSLDHEVAQTPMPEHLRGIEVGILCKDCHVKSVINFHVVGLKCADCGSYNTCRVQR